ncbi:FtsX-like permease family protein [Dactylosporangium siamense]|uniref:ABC3 transporter permease C-terminal domain-containing protein n=1 Tax=Dactylosporangium siamense TaxID=685454 RepID=A0A919UI56_9ACTN|nr:FtsX-like permease family protein [Dactylosporangium siamense]GIG52225.1 hypothetical protein Dsi01nite_102660 [Dactylosporangium siamense]
MIGFGLRLAVASGREALVRFVVLAAAVALGVALLLATVAGVHALDGQFGRSGWQQAKSTAGTPAADPLMWVNRWGYFEGRPLDRIDVGRTGPAAPAVPGIPAAPAPGQYYVSPALHDLIVSRPADELASRFPGHEAGLIDDSALASPDSLLIIVGRTAHEVGGIYGAHEVASVSTVAPPVPVAAINLVLSVIGGGLLFPVLIFISTATRLAATRREQRFAAMRLVGATPRQVSTLAAVESTAAAVLGTAAGFALFPALQAILARYPLTGQRFFPSDLSLRPPEILIVGLGVPAAAAIAARFAMRRVRISPLGVTRQVTPKPPRAWRLIPLLAGLAELAYFIDRRPHTSSGQTAAFLPGLLLIMAGLVIAGPWITMVAARFMAGRARRLPTLLAARRLADNPQAAFRAISGVVLGLFVVSVATGVITTLVEQRAVPETPLSDVTMTQSFHGADGTEVPDALLERLRGVEGVTFALVLHDNPDDGADSPSSVIPCADLARIPQYGRCEPGAAVAQIWDNLVGYDPGRAGVGAATVWRASAATAEDVAALPVDGVVVGLDGTSTAHERARTALQLAFPDLAVSAGSTTDFKGDYRNQLNQFQQLANVTMLFSLPIAACSLAVSVAAGIADRKRPFALLRLTGVPLRALRRVVALESAAPLLAVAVLAAAVGFTAAQLFLRAQMRYTMSPPPVSYYVLTALGLGVALTIIAATLPLLDRVSGPETARNE